MLEISIPSKECWDQKSETFVYLEGGVLQFEHSLVSLSKWEAKWKKSFLSGEEKTQDELADYIRCMVLNEDSLPLCSNLTASDYKKISDYINDPMTATKIKNNNKKRSREIITSEIIYYWMVAMQIPFECQYWHLNRLLTLIRVCNEKENPGKKMTRNQIYSQNRALNAARKAKYHTKG